MGTKRYYLLVLAVLPFIVAIMLSITLQEKPTSATPSSQPSSAPAVEDIPTCTPPTWNVTTSPNVGMGYNYLYGVAATSSNEVWAVGYSCAGSCTSNSDDPYRTLVQRWDGSQWSIVTSPNASMENNSLLGVAIVSATDVWAVGSFSTGGIPQTLIEHWNGSTWSIVPSSNAGTGSNNLSAVAVVSSNDVWAVGSYYNGSTNQTLIEHWNGVSWSVISSPNSNANNNELTSVSATSANDVWAVGYYFTGSTNQTLIEHWNGTSWSVTSSPNVGISANQLYGVAAVSVTEAWAVGYYAGSARQTLIEHWNGSAWSVIDSPNLGVGSNKLNGVMMRSATDVWAVGYYCNGCGSSDNRTLILHWNGSAWAVASSSNIGTSQNNLYAVASTAANDAWAVGSYYQNTSSNYQTLTEHWYGDALCPTPLPTATPILTPTPTACPVNFADVNPTDYFYAGVRYLYCAGVISGYSDGMFHPGNNTTRGQLSKIVVLAKGWPLDCPSTAHFSDVPMGSVFFCFVETAFSHNLVSGYSDGTFGVGNDITRAQLSKIIVQAQQWPIDTHGGPHFTDVLQTDPFYGFIETAYNHNVVSGYTGGTFNPGNSATRGQISKIVYQARGRE